MDREELITTLEGLHAELASAERVDPEALALLQKLTQDASRLLRERDELKAADVEPFSHGLKDVLLKFEAEHPKMAEALGKVADALAAIGI